MSLPAFVLALCEAFATASGAPLPMVASKNARFLSPTLLRIERAGSTGGGTVWGAKLNGRGNANRNDFQGDGSGTTFQTDIAYAALSNNNWIVRIDISTRTGTGAVTLGSNAVVGTSTAFLTELAVGKEIRINGETKTVTSITDDTHLTVDSNYIATATAQVISLINDILVPTTDFTVSSVGGLALITIGAAAKAPNGAQLSVHFVVPVALYTFATATVTFKNIELTGGYQVLWYKAGSTTAPSSTNIYIEAIGQ